LRPSNPVPAEKAAWLDDELIPVTPEYLQQLRDEVARERWGWVPDNNGVLYTFTMERTGEAFQQRGRFERLSDGKLNHAAAGKTEDGRDESTTTG
jgi:hypothetical protein